ncbi:17014_t:CDS:2 [Funneliformis caledonium]|uniref:17014_t:CDS:1 n=1 Tax=Funneliformis caledonium TaxID=1117310 RepID=A0A9N9CGL5_9GLOM|nr:17014_t:CDS:2 [Funneliformis caledonium]
MTEDGKEIKGSDLWSKKKYEIYQGLLLEALKGKRNYSENEEKKVVFEIYIDKETAKNKFEEEIKQRLEKTANEKIKIIVRLGLDSKNYPGIQMADIIANGLQRDYKRTGKTNKFEKYFKKKTNFKIAISKT